MKHSVSTAAWAGRQICFALLRGERKTLSISVNPDGEVLVRAPQDISLEDIIERVGRRGGWISRQQAYFEQWRPRTPPRTYEPGETHLVLGRQYRLDVRQGIQEGVMLEGDRLVLSMHRPSCVNTRREILARWYLVRAREVYARRLNVLFRSFAHDGHPRPRIIVRELSQRWGSLTKAGNMVLSRDLIRAPRVCIDYVIVHELCHLVYADHGPHFWALLDRLMPDHAKRKARLERVLL